MVGGFGSWVVQLLGGDTVHADDDGAGPDQAVEVAAEQVSPDEALPVLDTLPPTAPLAGSPRYLVGYGDRTSAMMAAMSGPGLCTPHL